MNSHFFAFVLSLLSVFFVIECDYKLEYRPGYKHRLSKIYNDDDYDGDNEYGHDYSSHYQRQYHQRYPRMRRGYQRRGILHGYRPVYTSSKSYDYYDEDYDSNHQSDYDYPNHNSRQYAQKYTRLKADYQRRGPSRRGLFSQDCFEPPPHEVLDRYYAHPTKSSCQVTYKEGHVHCFDRKTPEPQESHRRIYQAFLPLNLTERNPLYEGICPNMPAKTSMPCYTPRALDPQRMTQVMNNEYYIRYRHPTHSECDVDYGDGSVYCHGTSIGHFLHFLNGTKIFNPLYEKLCSFYCPDLLRVGLYCESTRPLKGPESLFRDCYMPPGQEVVGIYYAHPRDSNCKVVYKGGDVFCNDRDEPEARIILSPGNTKIYRIGNPIYYEICNDTLARTNMSCYAQPEAPNNQTHRYPHPSDPNCFVSYVNADVYCNDILQERYVRHSDGRDVPTHLYAKLCSFYCPDLLRIQSFCGSTRPLKAHTDKDLFGCYIPPPQAIVGKYYNHPRNFWNDSCVVTYIEGDVYCKGRHLDGFPPEPRNISVVNPDHGTTGGSLYYDERNPLYSEICRNAPASTTMPCYTPPVPSGPSIKHYQHPSDRNCYVSYAKGEVFCLGYMTPKLIVNSNNETIIAPVWKELCSSFCHELLPYTCESTHPTSCRICGSMI